MNPPIFFGPVVLSCRQVINIPSLIINLSNGQITFLLTVFISLQLSSVAG